MPEQTSEIVISLERNDHSAGRGKSVAFAAHSGPPRTKCPPVPFRREIIELPAAAHYSAKTVRQNFNLTDAANVLLTSQSGASKHIRDLEDDVGFEIFERPRQAPARLDRSGREVASRRRRISWKPGT